MGIPRPRVSARLAFVVPRPSLVSVDIVADGSRTWSYHCVRLLTVLSVLALASAGTAAWAGPGDTVPPNRVTVITDSVGGVLFWVAEARATLARGLDLDLETKTCRRLVDPGCPAYDDLAPSSALETIVSRGRELGPTVVIDVGYNDQPELYAAHLDEVMRALLAAGVRHVVWVTLGEAQESWALSNAQIRAAPQRWPQLVVADWAQASAGKQWFVDGVHMTSDGGLAFAEFLRPFVLQACGEPCAPPPLLAITTSRLPAGHVGKPYATALSARGGVLPYRWSVAGLPPGLHLSVDGRIRGVPRAKGISRVRLRLQDAWDDEGVLELALRVRR
jgi:hypothetical protein